MIIILVEMASNKVLVISDEDLEPRVFAHVQAARECMKDHSLNVFPYYFADLTDIKLTVGD